MARPRAPQDARVGNPFGLGFVFVNVLLMQLGVPLPATPTLVVAGALSADGRLPGAGVLGLAVLACLIGDSSWYLAGRRYGGRIMSYLCRISLTPDGCVGQTQARFERWGARALIVAKFIPGLSMIAPPLAGATRMPYRTFAACSVLGSLLWVGAAMLGGVLLRREIATLLPRLAGIGGAALALLVAALTVYVAFKWWERRRFYAALDMARMAVEELRQHLGASPAPLVIDVRSPTACTLQLQRIPGALHMPVHEVVVHLGDLPRDREVVLYCTCPNEASAAQAARALKARGFERVWPLRGGLEAWIAAGYAVEGITPQPGQPARLAPSP